MIAQDSAQVLIEINGNDVKAVYVRVADFPFKRIPVPPIDAMKLSEILKNITARGSGTLRNRFSDEATGLGPLEIR